MTSEVKLTNKIFFETMGVTIEDFKNGRKDVYEKLRESGKDALLKYLKNKAATGDESPTKMTE